MDGAELRDGDLEIGKHFEKKRLERLVGTVELVDQQHRRPGRIGLERFEHRPLDQKSLGEDIVREPRTVGDAFRLGGLDLDHLGRVVPFVYGAGHIEALVALQAHQAPAKLFGQHLGNLGLADPGLAFEEKGPAHGQGQEDRGRKPAVGDVAAAGEQLDGSVDARRLLAYRHPATARRAITFTRCAR